MPCSYCKNPGHNRSTCPEAPQGVRKQRKPREGGKEFVSCPRGYRPVRMADGTIVLMKHQELCPEKVMCECGVRVSAVDRRALMRHQSTKGHLEWASREINLFKTEFVGAPGDDGRQLQQLAAAIARERQAGDKPEATGDLVVARSVSKLAEPPSVRTSASTACNGGSVSPTSSASSAQELSSAAATSEPPSSWETQDGGSRWDQPAEAISSGWQVAYRSSHAERGHMSVGTSPVHQDPVALRPPPVQPSFTFDTTMPSLGDVASLAPAAALPSAEELYSIGAYGAFGY